ncbi:YicC family protein [candidate division KSB1 bacterium]|nr:YicC family protein [candidate division KSB1 bacterium]
MISSMTGYGRGEVKRNGKEVLVEIRSLNNRYLDISLRLSRMYTLMEDEVRNMIREKLSRGRINVVVTFKENTVPKNGSSFINMEVASSFFEQLRQLKEKLHLSGKIRLEHLLAHPELFTAEVEDLPGEEMVSILKEAVSEALDNLQAMRLSEGEELSADLTKRIKLLDEWITDIETLSTARIANEYTKLRERVGALITNREIDETRLEQEISIMASKIDVTEECIRFRSHNKLFLDFLNSETAVGRKLNFLLQEMTREANTIGSKAYDSEIAHLVVLIKEEVEKIREQVQNIE